MDQLISSIYRATTWWWSRNWYGIQRRQPTFKRNVNFNFLNWAHDNKINVFGLRSTLHGVESKGVFNFGLLASTNLSVLKKI